MSKKVSVERVDDLTRSVFSGRTVSRKKIYSRLDKVSLVSTFSEKSEMRKLWESLIQLSSNDCYQIKKHPAGENECSGLYQNVIEVRLKNRPEGHPLLMTIHFKPTAKNRRVLKGNDMICHERGAVRFEFSPQHYEPDELTDFVVWLGEEEQLGELSYQVLKNAWITRVDYALDIVGMRLRDHYLSLSGVSSGEVYDPDNGMEGLRIGNASLIAACYEKVDVRELSKREFNEASLLELNSSEYRDFLRIEMRLHPKKRDLYLKDLGNMQNLPKRLKFYNKALREDKKLDPEFASLLDQGMSIPQARTRYIPLSQINGKEVSSDKKNANKRLDNLLVKYEVELFDAEKLWGKLPKIIDNLGLIGKPQYWNVKLRNKWLGKK